MTLYALDGHFGSSGSAGFGLLASVSPAFAWWWRADPLVGSYFATNDLSGTNPRIPPCPFTLYARVGPGHYQITWQQGAYQIIGAARGYLHCPGGPHAFSISAAYMASPPIGTQGVELWTQLDTVPTDLDCSIVIQ